MSAQKRPTNKLALSAMALLLLSTQLLVAPSVSATPAGTQLWASRYQGDKLGSYPIAVTVSPDNSKVFVTGTSDGPGTDPDYATVAYSVSTGARLWTRRYNDPENNWDAAFSLAVSPNGSEVFVTGESGATTTTDQDYATVAYDASTGRTLWLRRYHGAAGPAGGSAARSVAVSPDGSEVFVTGNSGGPNAEADYATIAYEAATGDKLWVERYNGTGNGSGAESVAVSPDGSEVFVTGGSRGISSGVDYATVAYEASTGARLWTERYNGPGNGDDLADSMVVSPDGSEVFITGESSGPDTGNDYATVAYDASTGARLWTERYNGPANGWDYALSLAVSPDGSKVVVTGGSIGVTTHYDYATVAYEASTGARLWTRRYNDPRNGSDAGVSVSVSPDSSEVFVTGNVTTTTYRDFGTIAYDASTGRMLWLRQYNGPASGIDVAVSLAVSPNGSAVVVTGESAGTAGRGHDYATVAYKA